MYHFLYNQILKVSSKRVSFSFTSFFSTLTHGEVHDDAVTTHRASATMYHTTNLHFIFSFNVAKKEKRRQHIHTQHANDESLVPQR